ncbi:MAG: hypothetical protein GWP09_00170, partial [Nitrospiraceae bacterium]|nr:hypothetical protein [Nitrospiraceae bacterium]
TPYADAVNSQKEQKNVFGNEYDIELIPASSAGEVLYMLKTNRVDSVLIGRSAKKSELDDKVSSFRMLDGVTLVYKVKAGVPVEQLKEIEVLTYLKPEKIARVKNFFKKVTFLDTIDECLNSNLEIPVIIDWHDFRDDFELLIPMNDYGKVPEFRAPVLYYKVNMSDDFLLNLKKIISEVK